MTTDRDFDQIAMAWLADGPEELSDRVLDAVVDEVHVTRQRHGLRLPRRFESMTTPVRVGAAAVIGVLAIGGALYALAPGGSGPGGPGSSATPSPSPSPSPLALSEGPLAAGTYVATPFAEEGSGACFVPPQPECIDTTDDDAIQVAFIVPDGWSGTPGAAGVWPTDRGASAANLIIVRGASVYDDPCRTNADSSVAPEIAVGPTVDDFVNAVATHPLLDVTSPTDVTLDGYTGKYLELQVPADITGCDVYRPWEPWYYAQGPGELWRLWVLDVDGVRVVVQSVDLAGTSAETRAQLQAMVDSIQIEP